MKTHTAGPWYTTDGAEVCPMEGEAAHVTLAHVVGTQKGESSWIGQEEAVANAKLIAAAPDLLAAIQAVEKRLTACANAFYVSGKASALKAAFDGWKDDIAPARAAIAKALGNGV